MRRVAIFSITLALASVGPAEAAELWHCMLTDSIFGPEKLKMLFRVDGAIAYLIPAHGDILESFRVVENTREELFAVRNGPENVHLALDRRARTMNVIAKRPSGEVGYTKTGVCSKKST